MKSLVDYKVLGKFTDFDKLYLEFDKVRSDIRNIDMEYGLDVLFRYY